MSSAADECGWRDLKLVHIHPLRPGSEAQAEVLEAIINDIPEHRRAVVRAMEEAAEIFTRDIVEQEQRGLGWLTVKRIEEA